MGNSLYLGHMSLHLCASSHVHSDNTVTAERGGVEDCEFEARLGLYNKTLSEQRGRRVLKVEAGSCR